MPQLTLSVGEVEEGVLPPICIVCGARANHFNKTRFTWAPIWTHLMLPLGFLTCVGIWLWVIFRLVKHREMTVTVPLCVRHRYYWSKRKAFLPVGIFVTLASLIFVMSEMGDGRATPPAWALFIPISLLIATFAISILMLFRGTRVIEITKGTEIKFDGVDPRFIEAVEQGRREYEAKMEQWRERRNFDD